MNAIESIPLNRLQRSPRNVRRTGGTAIKDLAASIAAHGLLQNLSVLPAGDGSFEVVAGARRLAALNQLASENRIAPDHPVPCLILPAGNADETSLAENTVREAMHPADQFIAFSRLIEEGRSIGDIAARFGVSEVTVEQRLKLAHVAPSLIETYRQGGMKLEQLMAFTVTDDQAAQEAYWSRAHHWEREPRLIKAALTKGEIDAAADPRAKLVGLERYEAAGGVVRRDLFGGRNAGFLSDAALLDELTKQVLEAEAEKLRAEGWAWVEVRTEFDWRAEQQFERIQGKRVQPTEAEKAEAEALSAELEALRRKYDESEDELSDAEEERWEAIEAKMAALTERVEFSDVRKAKSGVVVTLDRAQGALRVVRGLVRKTSSGGEPAGKSGTRKPKAGKSARPEATKDVSDALARRLSAQRVAATRAELLGRSDVALLAIVHALLLDTLFAESAYDRYSALVLRVSHADADLQRDDESIANSAAWLAVEKAKEAVAREVSGRKALWGWLARQPQTRIQELLALGVALQLGGVQQSSELTTGTGGAYVPASIAIAEAVGLDMTKWWRPSVANYLGAVPKAKVLEALAEAGLKDDAHRLADGKSAAVAAEAEQLLAKTEWLPRLLRTSATVARVTTGEPYRPRHPQVVARERTSRAKKTPRNKAKATKPAKTANAKRAKATKKSRR
jgi:ParB family chromosome partitioning protein